MIDSSFLPQDKVGPFCRVAMDCGVITEAMLGKDPEDPGSVDATFQSPVDVDISSLRIGFARNADVEVSSLLPCAFDQQKFLCSWCITCSHGHACSAEYRIWAGNECELAVSSSRLL